LEFLSWSSCLEVHHFGFHVLEFMSLSSSPWTSSPCVHPLGFILIVRLVIRISSGIRCRQMLLHFAFALGTLHWVLCTGYFALGTLHWALGTWHLVLCSLHHLLFAPLALCTTCSLHHLLFALAVCTRCLALASGTCFWHLLLITVPTFLRKLCRLCVDCALL
jgi:hypothetical protein